MNTTRRSLVLGTSTLGLLAMAGCTTKPTAATVQADLQLILNGLAAVTPLIPSGSTVLGQIQAAVTAIQAALAGNPNGSTIQQVASMITRLAPLVIGLLPGGSIGITIVEAAVALLPELLALAGVTAAAPIATKMSAAQAHAVLSVLSMAPDM